MSVTSVPGVLVQGQDATINSANLSRVQVFPNCSGTFNINPTDGGFIQLNSIAADTTINFIGIPGLYRGAGGIGKYQPTIWYVEIANRGTKNITFNGVTWDGGSAPTIVSSGRTTLIFTSVYGTTISGAVLHVNLAS
jgi:hypothetical protein